MKNKKLAFVDLETTGGSFTKDKIIEVGIVLVEEGLITKQYKQLVNPMQYLNPFITSITGIRNSDLVDAPSFEFIAEEVNEMIKDADFFAHNARFDYSFLKEELSNEGFDLSTPYFCTAKLSRYFYPEYRRHNLDSLIERFGFGCENRHRAYDDAYVLYQFYNFLKDNFSDEVIDLALKSVRSMPYTPLHIRQNLIQNLPSTSGVYFFLDKNENPLYIGKAKNIKARVTSHFTQSSHSEKEMAISRQIHDIQTLKTAGELGALIREQQLIKKSSPLYNDMLKNKETYIVLEKKHRDDGYLGVEMRQLLPNEIYDPNVLKIFKSKRQAKEYLEEIASEKNLCKKLLGIEKTNKSCFLYNLSKCNGACIGKESSLSYNIRFEESIPKYFDTWLFNGPIVISEMNRNEMLTERLIF